MNLLVLLAKINCCFKETLVFKIVHYFIISQIIKHAYNALNCAAYAIILNARYVLLDICIWANV